MTENDEKQHDEGKGSPRIKITDRRVAHRGEGTAPADEAGAVPPGSPGHG
jgi:hypothetical protein